MRDFVHRIKSYLLHYTWDLAIAIPKDNEEGFLLPFSRYRVLKNPYKNKWFADPFILSYDGSKAELLVEEFDNSVNRGRIALLTIDIPKALIEDCKIVLDIETHLSYPAIYREGNRIYVVPENADSGSLNLYLWNPLDKQLELIHPIIHEPLADATILQTNAGFFLFTTSLPSPNGEDLSVYFSSEQYNGYEKQSIIRFSNNIARMAGAFFIDDLGRTIRPAQDCNGDYGKKIVFQSVSIKDSSFSFQDVFVLEPRGLNYAGLHTFNKYNGLQVIDIKRYDYPLFYQTKNILKGVK